MQAPVVELEIYWIPVLAFANAELFVLWMRVNAQRYTWHGSIVPIECDHQGKSEPSQR
jgi:hypothetical protein